MVKKLIIFLVLFSTQVILAQQDSITTIKLEPITLKVSRLTEKDILLPISITQIDLQNKTDVSQQLSFNEYLYGIPGLFALNANNFSQDLRVSIRGFGARSSFGIRGVKIIVDGIPETTPDGQGQIDNLNLSIIKNLEIIRGPSSTLYGNASGGVININTLDNLSTNVVKAGFTFGSYKMQQYQVAFGLEGESTSYIFQGNKINTDGFRQQSGFENYNFNLKMLHRFSKSTGLNLQLNYTDSPFAKDPGGLTIDEVNTDREQARQRNVDFKTEETIQQFKIGTNFKHISETLTLDTYVFYSFRNFYGLLPFEYGGIVDLGRDYFGNGSSFTFEQNFKNARNRVQMGYDIAVQQDNRSRFRNLEGELGEKTFSQIESFKSFGFYVLDHLFFGNFLVRTGLRYDRNILEAEDRFLSDGDDSGKFFLNSFNPSISFNYRLNSNSSLYTLISTSFETPSLSEFSSNPTGEGGFNEELKAQKARNYEIGYKFKNNEKHFEIVFFYIKTENDLIPFELEEFPDRTFYKNAGSTTRNGLEFFYNQKLVKNIKLRASYTYSDFRYSSFQTSSGNFTDNKLPAIPNHLASIALDYKNKKGVTIGIQTQYVGSLFTSDSNAVKVNDYSIVNLNFGFNVEAKQVKFLPFVGINNALNTKYNDNIRINAFGGRYYEPAPEFNMYGGVRVIF